MVQPVHRASITPTNSTTYCQQHNIHLKTKYFHHHNTSKHRLKNKTSKPPPSSSSTSSSISSTASEESISICIAAAMHLNIAFPPDVMVVSPICFLSCRSQRPCQATLKLPHAAVASSRRDQDFATFCVLTYVTFDVSGFYASPGVESPSPVERRLEVAGKEVVKSLDVGSKEVTFKTTLTNPSLYAVGIRRGGGGGGGGGLEGVPRPPALMPLRCVLYCMYEKYEKQLTISTIPVKMYVGLNLPTVALVSASAGICNKGRDM